MTPACRNFAKSFQAALYAQLENKPDTMRVIHERRWARVRGDAAALQRLVKVCWREPQLPRWRQLRRVVDAEYYGVFRGEA